MASHLWAGNNSKVKITAFDDLEQQGVIETDLILPEKKFYSRSAKLIYQTRAKLAKKNISLDNAKQEIYKIFQKIKNY